MNYRTLFLHTSCVPIFISRNFLFYVSREDNVKKKKKETRHCNGLIIFLHLSSFSLANRAKNYQIHFPSIVDEDC